MFFNSMHFLEIRGPFLARPDNLLARKAIFIELYLKRKQCIGIKLCTEVNFVRIKIVWKEQLCKHKV